MVELYKGTSVSKSLVNVQRSKSEDHWKDSAVLSDNNGMNKLQYRRHSTSSDEKSRHISNNENEINVKKSLLHEGSSTAVNNSLPGGLGLQPRSMMDLVEENGDEVRKRRVCVRKSVVEMK